MWTRIDWQAVLERYLPYLTNLGFAIVVLLAFGIAAGTVHRIVCRVGSARHVDADLARFLGRSAKFALWSFGLVTALGTVGVDVSALVAGLGLTGFALGFALKDIVSNLVAGVLILLYKPFRNGDFIKVAGMEGRVVDIDLRYTQLAANEDSIYVPNSMLFTNAIVVDRPAPPSAEPARPRGPAC